MQKLPWLAAAALFAVAGCRSAPDQAPPGPVAPPNQDANWFCEMGEQADEWACVQSTGLADAVADAGASDATAPSNRAAQAPPRETEPPAGNAGQTLPAAASPSAQAAAPPPAPPTARRPPPPPSAPASADMPLYQRLAYRPSGYVRLSELPAEFFVVQLVAVQTREALEKYAARQGLKNMTAARVERDGKLFYVLLLGIYEDRDRADRAAANLPPEFQDFTPWVRSLGSLQEAIGRGDELAGTDVI